MIGGWRPWQRWTVARRLGRHARREGGEPPADLLRRLREDIPSSPALVRHPDRPPLAGGERHGASRRWLAAASLAAALTAGVVGLRVWQEHSRDATRRLESASRPGGGAAAAARQANDEASSPPASLPAPPSAAPASPSPAPQPPSVPPPLAGSPALPPARSGEEPAQSLEGQRPRLEKTRRDGPSQPAWRPAAMPAAPSGIPATEAAPAEQAGEAVPPPPMPPAVLTPPKPTAAAAARLTFGAEAKVAAARAAPQPGPAAPLGSSFGADTGTDFYRRVRRGLLAEGRLPRAASVRADELANAFDLAGEVPAVGRPELSVEGAPLPVAGAAYLVRFEARGLMGRSSPDAVEVDFDPTVVARFRRVGATAHRGGAAALYEIELRPDVAAAPPASAAERVTAGPRPSAAAAATVPGPAAVSRMTAASPQPAAEPRAAPASPPGNGAQDRVIATLRVVSRDEGSIQGGALLAARVVRLYQLHPSWSAASPALRVQGLAVQLGQALAARDPGPHLREVRARAQALAAELPEDPKVAELLQLVDRAADLAGAPQGGTPSPP